jgi:hypothetical protein
MWKTDTPDFFVVEGRFVIKSKEDGTRFFFLIRKNQSNVKELGRSMNNGCRFMAARDIYINH